MNMNGSLCKDGMVLAGDDLERYSKRKGLCHICARTQTHKRVGKMLKRNQWEPLTIQNEYTGDYQIYKGYCIQPTCYTLDQAKELLGEKTVSFRTTVSAGSSIRSSIKKPPSTSSRRSSDESVPSMTQTRVPARQISGTSESSNKGKRPSLSVTWEREPSQMSGLSVSSTGMAGNTFPQRRPSHQSSSGNGSPTGSVTSYSRRPSRGSMPSKNNSSSGNASPNGSMSSLAAGSVVSRRSTRSSKTSHKWSTELPDIQVPFPSTSQLDPVAIKASDPSSEVADGSSHEVVIASNAAGISHDTSRDDQCEEKADTQQELEMGGANAKPDSKGIFKKLFKGRKSTKSEPEPEPKDVSNKEQGDSQLEGSAASLNDDKSLEKGDDSTVNSSVTHSDSDTSLKELLGDGTHCAALPGSGFVSLGIEDSYRTALEALDLAAQGPSAVLKTPMDSGELQALCLQSKQLDYLDIEMLAVEVDERQRQWINHEFLLEDSLHPNNGKQVILDFGDGICLSQNYSNDIEELELVANLAQYDAAFSETGSHGSMEFLTFTTRAALEAEIVACEETVVLAEQSDEPDLIQQGIIAQRRFERLIALRGEYRTKEEIEKKIKKVSKSMGRLRNRDLDKRLKIAEEKAELEKQLDAEIADEELWRKSREQRSSPTKPRRADGAQTNNKDDAIEASLKEQDANTTTGSIQIGRSINIENDASLSDLDASYQSHSLFSSRTAIEVHMTVFQSAPLAYVDPKTGIHHVCPLLDFDYEARALTQSIKDAEGSGARIDVQFDIATTDRLSAFLARNDSRVMHLSCHGHPNFLALEDGFGGMQVLPVRDLKRFIATGTGSLEVVFVSACHSRAAGKAFLDAGIRHVVCCRQDDKFRDEGAIEFARNFYRAIALNNSLKQAFIMAREAMRVSPMVKDSRKESDKFILLPEKPDDDPYHDVYVFSKAAGTTENIAQAEEEHISTTIDHNRILPRIPQFFVGREVDMFTILESLRSNDVVCVRGQADIGKSSLVAATARYIERRHKAFLIDDIFWLPLHENAIDGNDKLYLNLSRIISVMTQANDTPCHYGGAYIVHWGRIIRQLRDKRILLVIHGRDFVSEASLLSLEYFLSELQRVANVKAILVGFRAAEVGVTFGGQCVDIAPLEFEATVLLFARLSKSPVYSSAEITAAMKPLLNDKASWRRAKIFERIGAGIPAAIRAAALDISDEDLSELMRLAKRPTVSFSSRAQLEEEIDIKAHEETRELDKKNYLLARDIRETIEELESLRSDFPSLAVLLEREKTLNTALKQAITSKNYDQASKIQGQLKDLQERTSNEMQWKETINLRRLPSF